MEIHDKIIVVLEDLPAKTLVNIWNKYAHDEGYDEEIIWPNNYDSWFKLFDKYSAPDFIEFLINSKDCYAFEDDDWITWDPYAKEIQTFRHEDILLHMDQHALADWIIETQTWHSYPEYFKNIIGE